MAAPRALIRTAGPWAWAKDCLLSAVHGCWLLLPAARSVPQRLACDLGRASGAGSSATWQAASDEQREGDPANRQAADQKGRPNTWEPPVIKARGTRKRPNNWPAPVLGPLASQVAVAPSCGSPSTMKPNSATGSQSSPTKALQPLKPQGLVGKQSKPGGPWRGPSMPLPWGLWPRQKLAARLRIGSARHFRRCGQRPTLAAARCCGPKGVGPTVGRSASRLQMFNGELCEPSR